MKQNILHLIIFAIILIAANSCKKDEDNKAEPIPPDPETQTEIYKTIDSVLSPLIESHLDSIPGIAVGVTRNQEDIFSKYYGYANLEQKEKLTKSHYFRMCSNSKIFICYRFVNIGRSGKLGLHDFVKEYIPEITNINDPYNAVDSMKVLHLFCHRAGFAKEMESIYATEEHNLEEMMQIIIANEEMLYPVGQQFHYSNVGFIVGGRIIEIVAGKDFSTFMKEDVLEKIGMENSTYVIDNTIIPKLTTPYDEDLNPSDYVGNYNYHAAGNLVSNVNDMREFLKYMTLDSTQGNPIMDYSTQQLMFKDYYGDYYGLGCYVYPSSISHGGSYSIGYRCGYRIQFNENVEITVMGNGYNLTPDIRYSFYDAIYKAVQIYDISE